MHVELERENQALTTIARLLFVSKETGCVSSFSCNQNEVAIDVVVCGSVAVCAESCCCMLLLRVCFLDELYIHFSGGIIRRAENSPYVFVLMVRIFLF